MSTNSETCEALRDLIGVYALDAVEADEAERVDRHLVGCRRCAQECSRYRTALGALVGDGEPAPIELWSRISALIATQPLESEIVPRRGPPGRAGARSGRPITRRALAAIAAAVVLALIGLQAAHVSSLDHQVGRLKATMVEPGGYQGPAAALDDPTAEHMMLTDVAPGSPTVGQIVIQRSGRAFLVDARLPPLPSDRTYQMWSLVSGHTISVAVIGPDPTTLGFTVDPDLPTTGFMVTVEPAGGVVTPTSRPVAWTVV